MPELAFASASSGAVTAAIWATLASLAASLLLLAYTLELRIHRRLREKRRLRVVAHWRERIAAAVTGADDGAGVPSDVPRRERREFLRLWNLTRNMVEGEAAERLIALARRLGLPELMRREALHSRPATRLIAIQTLGHLRDAPSFDCVLAAIDDENPLVSVTAAEALVDIDPPRAVDVLILRIAGRREWSRTQVFRMLRKAGSTVVGEPLFRAIRIASDNDAAFLLQFAELAEFDVRDAICVELLRSREDPELIASALKAASGYTPMPRIGELVGHPAWYVRMRAAQLIGRMGRRDDTPLLERLLGDPEWWVRYRAARALARLHAIDRPALERIRDRQADAFARDILDQAMVEPEPAR
jgi:HEAT repeat protein